MNKGRYIILCSLVGLLILILMPINALAVDTSGWYWPVPDSLRMSRGYFSGHQGLDIISTRDLNETIVAARAGTVIAVYEGCSVWDGYGRSHSACNPVAHLTSGDQWGIRYMQNDGGTEVCNYGIGNGVVIDHGNGVWTEYSHMATVSVSLGQYVSGGTAIGTMGSYGNSTGRHLHFAIRENAYMSSGGYPHGDAVNSNAYGDEYVINGSWNGVDNIWYTRNYNRDPRGYLDSATGGYGTIRVCGWAIDDDTPNQAVNVHLYADGPAGTGTFVKGFVADMDSSDVGKHRFDVTIETDLRGEHTLYPYAINTQEGNNPLLNNPTGKPITVNIQDNAKLNVALNLDGTAVSSVRDCGWYDVYIDGKSVADNQTAPAAYPVKPGSSYNIYAHSLDNRYNMDPNNPPAYVVTATNAEGTMGSLGRTAVLDFKTIRNELAAPQITTSTLGNDVHVEWLPSPLIGTDDDRVYDFKVTHSNGYNSEFPTQVGITATSHDFRLSPGSYIVRVTAINANHPEVRTYSYQSLKVWGELETPETLNLSVGDTRIWRNNPDTGESMDLIVITASAQKDWMDKIRWEFGDPSVVEVDDYHLYARNPGSTTATFYFEDEPLNAKTFTINVSPSQETIDEDRTPPRLDMGRVTRITPQGYTYQYRVSDNLAISKIVTSVILEGQSVNDGINSTINLNPMQATYEGTVNVDIADFDNAVDCWYRIFIFIYDAKGNQANNASRQARVFIPSLSRSGNVLTLPEDLREIPEAAFEDDANIGEVVLPEGLAAIGARAFAGCSGLGLVTVPDSVTSIDTTAFVGSDNAVLLCPAGSVAATFAWDNDIPYLTALQ